MAFVGQRLIAAVAGERLWVWDPYDGGHADLAGGYLAMAPLAGGRLLALGGHGQGDVVEIDRSRWPLTVRRTVCLAASGDCRNRALVEEIVANHGRLPRPTQRELAASPRGDEIAVFEWPWQDPSSGDTRKGRLAVLSADTLTVLRSTPVDECERDDPLEFGARQIVACGVRRDATTLAPVAPEAIPSSATRSDNGWPKPGADPLFDILGPNHQRIALGRASIGVGRQRDGGYESIVIANAKGELVGILASTASADVAGTRVYDRTQLRSDTTVVPSPDGSRFLIAGRGADGALQLWCTPTDGLGDVPPEPPRPDVMERGGITEIAVPDFPVVVADAVEMSAEVLMLGVEPHAPEVLEPKRGLWAYAPATRKLARVGLPVVPGAAAAVAAATTMSGAPPADPEVWQRFELAPGGGVWLIGKRHVARRGADGGWIVHPLPEGTTNQIAVIDDALAVHVGIRACAGAKPRPRVGGPGSCFDLTLLGVVPASAGAPVRTSNEWVGTLAPFPGGFVALGGAELGFRDGRWVGPRDPLVVTAANTFATEGFGRADEVYLHVQDTNRIDVLGVADGRKRRTFELPYPGRIAPLGASPGHGPAFWVEGAGGEGAIVDVDASGKATVRGNAALPAWMAGETFRARGGATALWWHGGSALIGLDPAHWTATFNPVERARLLTTRRVY
jgi:hypothetical protein